MDKILLTEWMPHPKYENHEVRYNAKTEKEVMVLFPEGLVGSQCWVWQYENEPKISGYDINKEKARKAADAELREMGFLFWEETGSVEEILTNEQRKLIRMMLSIIDECTDDMGYCLVCNPGSGKEHEINCGKMEVLKKIKELFPGIYDWEY